MTFFSVGLNPLNLNPGLDSGFRIQREVGFKIQIQGFESIESDSINFKLINYLASCYGPYHTLALHEWEQSTAKAYAASLSSSTKIYGEYLDRYYEQVRKYQ